MFEYYIRSKISWGQNGFIHFRLIATTLCFPRLHFSYDFSTMCLVHSFALLISTFFFAFFHLLLLLQDNNRFRTVTFTKIWQKLKPKWLHDSYIKYELKLKWLTMMTPNGWTIVVWPGPVWYCLICTALPVVGYLEVKWNKFAVKSELVCISKALLTFKLRLSCHCTRLLTNWLSDS